MKRLLIATAAIAVVVAGCGSSAGDDPTANPTSAGAIEISDAWARPSPGGSTTTAIYMTISNTGAEIDTLIAADGSPCRATEIHMSTIDDAGVMRMSMATDGISIPPEASVILGPGGLHIMCLGVDEPLELGGTTEVTLTFGTAGTTTVGATIRNDE